MNFDPFVRNSTFGFPMNDDPPLAAWYNSNTAWLRVTSTTSTSSEMTLQDFKKKYGTDTLNLLIDHLVGRIATKSTLSDYDWRVIAEMKQDLKELLK